MLISHIDGKTGEVKIIEVPDEPVVEIIPNAVDYPLKRWQFKAMVDYLSIGPAIEEVINSFPDPLQRSIIMARYKESDVYNRDDPLFNQIAPLIGLNLKDLDKAWLQIALN